MGGRGWKGEGGGEGCRVGALDLCGLGRKIQLESVVGIKAETMHHKIDPSTSTRLGVSGSKESR